MTLPVTPLKKHPGQNGALVAMVTLALTTTIVLATRPHKAAVPVDTPARAIALPAASVEPVVERVAPPEPGCPRIVTATGTTTYDEKLTNHVGPPVAGWLVKTRAKSLGRRVQSAPAPAACMSTDCGRRGSLVKSVVEAS